MHRTARLCLSGLALGIATGFLSAPALAAPPNFIVIQGEAHGWSSLPVPLDDKTPSARSRDAAMPNFERIAKEGVRFSRFYAASPRCTPSRAALLTGKSPAQLHMTFVGEGRRDDSGPNTPMLPPRTIMEIPGSDVTIAELLQGKGYVSAHYGKWHVGRMDPARHGFADNDGPNSNGGPDNSRDPAAEQTALTGRKSVEFIEKSVAAGKPFFLQLDQYASRDPAAQELLDKALGQILKALEEKKIAGNTWIFYTADHGDAGRNPPLRGGKGFLTEGGIRVPLLAWGPGASKGASIPTPAVGMDLLPTIAELAGVSELPAKIEGGSLVALMKSGQAGIVKRSREPLFFHFPHYDHGNGGPVSAVVLGDWKLLRYYETGKDYLYNLADDPSESRNLASEQPERAADLAKRLDVYLKEVDASFATKNPNFDPSKPTDTDQLRGGGFRPGGDDAGGTPRPGGQRGGGSGGGQGRGRGGNRNQPPPTVSRNTLSSRVRIGGTA